MEGVQDAPVVSSTTPAEPIVETPATDAAPVARKSLRELTPAERHEWRKTGELPEAAPKDSSAAPAPEPTVATEPPASTEAVTAPASDPAKPVVKSKADKRKDELAAEIQELLTHRATIRAEVEAEERRRQPPPAPEPSALKEPDPSDAKYAFGTADPQYIKDMIAFGAAQERATNDARARQAQAAADWTKTATAFQERCDAVGKEIPDFKAVALDADSPIKRGSVIDLAIWEDGNGPKMLYHLHKNPAEIARIEKLSVWDQTKELVRLSDRLAARPAPAQTQAPEPVTVLPTRGSSTDPIAAAVKTRDFRSYRDNVNNDELARRGSRRA